MTWTPVTGPLPMVHKPYQNLCTELASLERIYRNAVYKPDPYGDFLQQVWLQWVYYRKLCSELGLDPEVNWVLTR